MKKLTKIKMFLLDICDENVGSMPYFVYPTPPAKQHRRIWEKKSHESTKICDTAKIEHNTAKPCPYFGGIVYIITHEREKQDKIFWVIWMLSDNQPVTDS